MELSLGQGYRVPASAATIIQKTRVLFVVAPSNFRDEEFQQPYLRLKEAGAKVVVASVGVDAAFGMLGMRVKVDVDATKANMDDFDVLVLIGGSGVIEHKLDENKAILALVKQAFALRKLVGAICVAPRILAAAKVLDGRYVTCWRDPETIDIVKKAGAVYVREPSVHDGQLVTADGPASAERFARTLIDAITA